MSNKYMKPFLNQVIVRIDFAIPIKILEKAIPEKLKEVITNIYPFSDNQQILKENVKIHFEEKSANISKEQDAITQWVFHDGNNINSLTLNRESLYVVIAKYDKFESLEKLFIDVVEELYRVDQNIKINRFGLRYVNNIEPGDTNPLNWNKYLDKNLLGIFKVPKEDKIISRAFHSLHLNYGEFSLHFQYGMHNPDFPAVIKKKIFILDFDAYYKGLISNYQEVREYLNRFHDEIETLFEYCITDRLRALMEVVKDG